MALKGVPRITPKKWVLKIVKFTIVQHNIQSEMLSGTFAAKDSSNLLDISCRKLLSNTLQLIIVSSTCLGTCVLLIYKLLLNSK